METPTPQKLEEIIEELKELLEFSNDPEIIDELQKEIKYIENQLRDITIQNEVL